MPQISLANVDSDRKPSLAYPTLQKNHKGSRRGGHRGLSSFAVRTTTSLSRTSPHSLEVLVRNGNRVYNIPACRGAHFHKGIKSGANSRNRKPLEAVPRGESGSPGAARGQFQGATGRIRDGHGPIRLWQVVPPLRDRGAGAVLARAGPGGRQRPGSHERRRAHQASAA